MISIKGHWNQGFSYDFHSVSSIRTGENEFGHPVFDTKRSVMGEYVYQIKYKQNMKVIPEIIDLLSKDNEFSSFMNGIDIIVLAPPSNKGRVLQPVTMIGQKIAEFFRKEIYFDAIKSSNAEQIKNIDMSEKLETVKKSLVIKDELDKTKNILIFDDVFDSGSTLQAIAELLSEKGFKNIKVFTLTKTKKAD